MYRAKELTVATRGRGFYDITNEVQRAVAESGAQEGLCTIFLHHTSASLVLCENADPDVRRDLEAFFSKLVKDGDPLFRHDAEGPDDMPAHIKASLLGPSFSLPVADGDLALGTWQGVYLCEHRDRGGARSLVATLQGDAG